MEIQQCSRTT